MPHTRIRPFFPGEDVQTQKDQKRQTERIKAGFGLGWGKIIWSDRVREEPILVPL